ncbi:MAG TPA: 4-phosphoerythronate dehydrogenase [Planctomycetes bacterium]|nr:4-phosphoerythronate dehydrogenase [Planctomycetota bacterium]
MSAKPSILADENIPYARQAFEDIGRVRLMPGRNMRPDDVRNCDALLVRSVTTVDAKLLDGSSVAFVGTATIGTDHADEKYLRKQGIRFASAPGSNALSVAEYVTAALLELCAAGILKPPAVTVAVIGVGNVGGRVAAKLDALGFPSLLNDPPLAEATGDKKYRPLDEILPLADVVTLHVPLTREGPCPTHRMADAAFFAAMKPGAVFINTSRGSVMDELALKKALSDNRLSAAVLDVWSEEPDINVETLERAFIATPHIAGYSFDGKVRGTQMLYDALAAYLGIPAKWKMEHALPPPVIPEIALPKCDEPYETVRKAVCAVYDVREDDGRMRKLRLLTPPNRGAYFDCLRKSYPVRREFPNTRIVGGGDTRALEMLAKCGFQVKG